MLQLDLPTINALTKIDQLADREPLPFNLDFYTEVHDLNYLLPSLEAEQRGEQSPTPSKDVDDDNKNSNSAQQPSSDNPPQPSLSRFHALNNAIISLINDFALVAFEPVFVEDKATMASLLHAADKASGYAFGPGTMGANETVWTVAVRQDAVKVDVADVQERWIDRRREMDEIERERWREEAGAGAGYAEGEGDDDGGKEEDEFDEQLRKGVDVGGIKVVRVAKENLPKDEKG
jgi:GPN-loop GTPase